MIGHTAILYRRQTDPEKRKIAIPTRELTIQKRQATC